MSYTPTTNHETLIAIFKAALKSEITTETQSSTITPDKTQFKELASFFDFEQPSTTTEHHVQTENDVQLLTLEYFTTNNNNNYSMLDT